MSERGMWVIASLALLPGAFAIAFFWVTQTSPVARRVLSYQGLAGPFFVPFAVLFGLFAAFLANDIWVRAQDRSDEIEESLEIETSALRSLQRIAIGLGDRGAGVEATLSEYVETSSAEGGRSAGQWGSGAADNSLQRLVTEILGPHLSEIRYAVAQEQMLALCHDIGRARAQHVRSALYESDLSKWMGMIILGLLTQAAIAMVHVENSKAQAAGLVLFSLAFSVVLVIVSISETAVAGFPLGYPDISALLAK